MYTLSIISVGFVFKSTLLIPLPLPGHEGVAIDLRVQNVPGYGITAFIVALIWSILLGNAFLEIHIRSKHWEEHRRSMAAMRNHISSATPPSDAHDTPFIQRVESSSLVSPSSRRAESGGSVRTIPFASLLGDLVRRTSFHVMESVRGNHGEPTEALWERSYTPIGSKRHSFSCAGVIFITLLLIFTLFASLMGMLEKSLGFLRTGAVPAILLSAEQADMTFNIPEMVDAVVEVGGPAGAHSLANLFLTVAVVMPVLHLVGLLVMWLARFTPTQQRHFFRVVEFLSAWSSLDVLLMALIVSWLGMENISSSVVEVVVPGLTKAVRFLAPEEQNVMVIHSRLLPGFWWIVVAVIAEKIMSYFLLELSAIAIAQRAVRERSYLDQTSSPRQLLPDELMQFSPAARYAAVSAMPVAYFYAGWPIQIWKAAIRLGVLDERPSDEFNNRPRVESTAI